MQKELNCRFFFAGLGAPNLVQLVQYIGAESNLHIGHLFSNCETIFVTVVSFKFDHRQCSVSFNCKGSKDITNTNKGASTIRFRHT